MKNHVRIHLSICRAFGFLALVLWSVVSSADTGVYWFETYFVPNPIQYSNVNESIITLTYCRSLNPDYPDGAYKYTELLVNSSSKYTCRRSAGASWYLVATWDKMNGTCPVDIPYSDPATGECTEAPECPLGQVNLGNGCENVCQSGDGPFTRTFQSPIPMTRSEVYDGFGCEETVSEITDCTTTDLNTFYCTAEYTGTGNTTEPTDYADEPQQASAPEPDPNEHPPKTTTEVDGPTSTSSGSDPEIVETDKTTTTTKDEGTTTEWLNDNTFVKKNSSGEIVEIIQQKTQNIYADGSGTETITEITSMTPATGTITYHNPVTGETVTETYTSGQNGSKTTVITKTFGPGGEQTGVTSETTGDNVTPSPGTGSGDGEGEGGSAFCEYAAVVCDFIDWFTEEPTLEDPETLEIEDIDSGEYEYNSGLPTLGSCPAPRSIAIGAVNGIGAGVEIPYDYICQYAEEIRPFVLLSAAMIAVMMLVRARG